MALGSSLRLVRASTLLIEYLQRQHEEWWLRKQKEVLEEEKFQWNIEEDKTEILVAPREK